MILILTACVAPELYDMASPLINPGESEPALFYEGPGLLVEGWCDGPGLDLTVEPAGLWPALVAPDELAEVWVVAAADAAGGEWWCSVRAGGELHEVSVLVVEL